MDGGETGWGSVVLASALSGAPATCGLPASGRARHGRVAIRNALRLNHQPGESVNDEITSHRVVPYCASAGVPAPLSLANFRQVGHEWPVRRLIRTSGSAPTSPNRICCLIFLVSLPFWRSPTGNCESPCSPPTPTCGNRSEVWSSPEEKARFRKTRNGRRFAIFLVRSDAAGYFNPTRRSRSSNRGSGRSESNMELTLSHIRLLDRSTYDFSSHSNALSRSPNPR